MSSLSAVCKDHVKCLKFKNKLKKVFFCTSGLGQGICLLAKSSVYLAGLLRIFCLFTNSRINSYSKNGEKRTSTIGHLWPIR